MLECRGRERARHSRGTEGFVAPATAFGAGRARSATIDLSWAGGPRRLRAAWAKRWRRTVSDPGLRRAFLVALPLLLGSSCSDDRRLDKGGSPSPPPSKATYVGSESCRACHEGVYSIWQHSHHARAEEALDGEAHRGAFEGQSPLEHGSKTTEFSSSQGRFGLSTLGASGEIEQYQPTRTIGVAPLWQVLVPGEGGRYQATEVAYDPRQKEWFDVFGDEDRRSEEWGFWTNRGMNWNSMCATCHNTDVQKGYRPDSDTYETSMAEPSIGCEACHGPGSAHVEWHTSHRGAAGAPAMASAAWRRNPDLRMEQCGRCHSRRAELRDGFTPGDRFLDTFIPEIPDLSDNYFADGQVLGENFEYVSFQMSRLHAGGVTCLSCHDPHSGKTRLAGNDLCMSCHTNGVSDRIGPLDPATHSHHDPAGPGGQCVNCHMPLTTYMQRHPRHDHSFSIPDPLLTKRFGIPNACNRCHEDESVEWALAATDQWWGERMDRPSRDRAIALARARRGDLPALPGVVSLTDESHAPMWRAVAALHLAAYLDQPDGQAALGKLLRDPEPLVRTMAVRAMDAVAEYTAPLLQTLLDDAFRSVRVMAAWSLRSNLDESLAVADELEEFLIHNSDQPAGARMRGVYFLDRNQAQQALPHLERSVQWDPGSSVLRHTLAIAQSSLGQFDQALQSCRKACELSPDDGPLWYSLGLAEAEAGDVGRAVEALANATRLEPSLHRAWYNLGLAQNQIGEGEEAMRSLHRAANLVPGSAEYWFGLASVCRDQGDLEQTRWALQKTVEADPRHRPAYELAQSLGLSLR